MIKYDKYFHQRHIFIKVAKSLLIILRMADSNQPHILRMAYSKQPHMDKLRFMVLMVYNRISMSMPDINDKYYFPLVTELEYDEYKECYDDDNPTE